MKKLLTLALATALCLTCAVSLTACGHSCTYTDAWSSDATSHWHTCTDADCTEIADHAAHNWKPGDVITPAARGEEGTRHFTCAVCGFAKTDTYNLSTTVPSNEWESAFLLGDNYTVTQTAEHLSLGTVTTVGKRQGNHFSLFEQTARISGEVMKISQQYWSIEGDNCYVFSPKRQAGEIVGFYKNRLTTETPESLTAWHVLEFLPQAARSFGKYTYHVDTCAYTATAITAEGVTLTDVTLTFLEGKVDSLAYTTVEGDTTVRYTLSITYGTTEVALPTNLLN